MPQSEKIKAAASKIKASVDKIKATLPDKIKADLTDKIKAAFPDKIKADLEDLINDLGSGPDDVKADKIKAAIEKIKAELDDKIKAADLLIPEMFTLLISELVPDADYTEMMNCHEEIIAQGEDLEKENKNLREIAAELKLENFKMLNPV